jgi:hypothetical protein
MEPTYTALGSDSAQYGPVTAEQLRGWIRDGRVVATTRIWRSDMPDWVAASTLPELGITSPTVGAIPASAPAAVPMHVNMSTTDPEADRAISRGASWLYWIAGLSLVNSISALTGSDWRFFLGLGVTQIIDGLAAQLGSSGKIVALVLDLLIAGALIVLGVFAHKRHGWAFIVGIVLLGLDAAVVALLAITSGAGSIWISFAFHLWVMFAIFRGFQASRASG